MPKRVPIALMAALCLSLAACGNGAGTASNSRDVAKQDLAEMLSLASTKTLEADSLRFSIEINTPGLGAITGEGEQDVAGRKMRMSMTIPVPGAGTMSMDQIMAGTVIYMRGGMFEGLLPPGIWARLDLAAAGEELGIDIGALLDQASSMDAQGAANLLRGIQGDVTEVGEETVRGVPTTRYSYTVDLSEASENLPPELAAQVKPMFDQMGVDTFPAEVWLDGDGMLRRMVYTMTIPIDGEAPQTVETKMEFFDFGSEVNIAEPPASQTVDLAEMMGEDG